MVGNRAAGKVSHVTAVVSIEEEDALVEADVSVVNRDQRANKVHNSAAIFTGNCCIRNAFIRINRWRGIASGKPGGGGGSEGEGLVHNPKRATQACMYESSSDSYQIPLCESFLTCH